MSPQARARGLNRSPWCDGRRSECTTLHVTYPTLRTATLSSGWQEQSHKQCYFLRAEMSVWILSHCYLEGIMSQLHRRWGLALRSRVTVPLRHLHTHTPVPQEVHFRWQI